MKSPKNGKKRRKKKETTLERTSSNTFFILGECWKGLSPPISETEIVAKWYTCIFKAKKKTYLYIGRATRFLNDEGGLITTLEIDCLKQKLDVTNNVLKQGQQDIGIFVVKDVICGPLQMFPLQCSRWECPKYTKIYFLFEKAKKDDREQLYNHFVCSMLKEINSKWDQNFGHCFPFLSLNLNCKIFGNYAEKIIFNYSTGSSNYSALNV